MADDKKDRLYLWVDLETTGDRFDFDDILEVGWFITDEDYLILHGGENDIIEPADRLWYNKMIPVVKEMHEKSGLTADLQGDHIKTDLSIAEASIIRALRDVDPHMVCEWVLAGSGVAHFDLHFIHKQMEQLSQLLAYFCIDVGQQRRFLTDICGVPMDAIAEQIAQVRYLSHRAYDDIRNHHQEAILYRDLVRRYAFPPSLFDKTGE